VQCIRAQEAQKSESATERNIGSGIVAEGQGPIPLFPKYGSVGKLSENAHPKVQNLCLKYPHLGEIWGQN